MVVDLYRAGVAMTPSTIAPSPEALAEWVKSTCLTFGTTVATAYEVAGLFVKGLGRPICPRCNGWADDGSVMHDVRGGCYSAPDSGSDEAVDWREINRRQHATGITATHGEDGEPLQAGA